MEFLKFDDIFCEIGNILQVAVTKRGNNRTNKQIPLSPDITPRS